MADAVISRRSEFVADRFAADHGLAPERAAALHAMDDAGRAASTGWRSGSRRPTPSAEQRIRALLAATTAARV